MDEEPQALTAQKQVSWSAGWLVCWSARESN
jgi:hypothetical protein